MNNSNGDDIRLEHCQSPRGTAALELRLHNRGDLPPGGLPQRWPWKNHAAVRAGSQTDS